MRRVCLLESRFVFLSFSLSLSQEGIVCAFFRVPSRFHNRPSRGNITKTDNSKKKDEKERKGQKRGKKENKEGGG